VYHIQRPAAIPCTQAGVTHVVAPTIEIAAPGGVPPVVPMRIMGAISLAVTELALAGWTLFATNVPSDASCMQK